MVRDMQSEQMQNKELVVKYLVGESTENEKLAIDQWLNEKLGNKRDFDELEFLWKVAGLTMEIEEDAKRNDWENILGRIGKKAEYKLIKLKERQPETHKISPSRSRDFLNKFLKIAAIFIVAFSFSWAAFYFVNKRPQSDSRAYNQVITAKGQKSQIILSDGTRVWLNAETVLKYPAAFNEDQREVYLEGEAFFEVQKKKNKIPFVVKTTDIDIEVLGTCFNVMAYSDLDSFEEVTLECGKVRIEKIKGDGTSVKLMDLKPGQHIRLDNNLNTVIITNNETVKYTAWKDGKMVFRNDPLERVIRNLERFYNVEIEVKDEQLFKYHFHATIVEETLFEALKLLKLSSAIDYKICVREKNKDGSYNKRKIILFKSTKR